MDFHNKTVQNTLKELSSDINFGLDNVKVEQSAKKYGKNVLNKTKTKSFFQRVIEAFKEPMLIILLFGFALAFGTELGKFLKTGEFDFAECVGILLAVILSVAITLIMEGSSQKAFNALGRIYDNLSVRVIRSGRKVVISQSDVVVGDIIILESGDKIVADGRLVESNGLLVDESALTGESLPVNKDYSEVFKGSTPLAERKNCVYSGTFITAGSGKMVVTAIGNLTEIGGIAGELSNETQNSPLQNKLGKLGKIITIIGACSAITVFAISIIRLYLSGGLDFSSVQNLFVSCIILIVAAVPEGLPTIVAVSLALNMIKLAKENALIKKMTATETAGAVSVICSDKTGTLTENKMSVVSVCKNKYCTSPDKITQEILLQNFVCNSTADIVKGENGYSVIGSATEGALLQSFTKSRPNLRYDEYRKSYEIIDREPFSSDKKFMTTTLNLGESNRKLVKGAPEVVLLQCDITDGQRRKILEEISVHQRKAQRVICFAHKDYKKDYKDEIKDKYVYDGYVAVCDPIRKEVKRAVSDCQRAGIKVKILTGDNAETAFAIARELNLAQNLGEVITARDIENVDDEKLKLILKKVTVIARSTPIIKLRVVKALKEMGEVVAVTGDGINDAPAIKHADVGIAMGINGSEISKEAADVVLLDDSFATVVKAISFGRNVYKNLQRFILFQLSVNLSALLFITICAIIGVNSPFSTLQLLWINVIMDGPPALTLGMESVNSRLMNNSPVKRTESIVNFKMLARIIFNGVFVGGIMLVQYVTNFLKVPFEERAGAIFTLFILFQLFNAFNSRELGAGSIFKSIAENKIMLVTFTGVFILHVIIVQFCSSAFSITPLSFSTWLKTIATALSIIVVSEIYKLLYRILKKRCATCIKMPKICKRNKTRILVNK